MNEKLAIFVLGMALEACSLSVLMKLGLFLCSIYFSKPEDKKEK